MIGAGPTATARPAWRLVLLASLLIVGAAVAPAAAAVPAAIPAGVRSGSVPPSANLPAGTRPGPRAAALCAGCSYNWSGYAQVASHRHLFTGITDSFVVPTVTSSTAGGQMAADWVGIGGYSDGTLVQAGIETDAATVGGRMTVTYNAWTEILPQAERALSLVVQAGDTVTITVRQMTRTTWLMEVQDGTQVGQRTVTYRSRGLSAEAVHERPCIASPCRNPGNLASLTQTGVMTFGPGSVSETAPGQTPVTVPLLGTVPGAVLQPLTMVANDGSTVIAVASAPDAADDAFAVADGSVAPPAPTV